MATRRHGRGDNSQGDWIRVMPRTLISQAARAMNARRKTRAGGRPRSKAERCGCQVMTLARAKARGRTSEHQAGCEFAKD